MKKIIFLDIDGVLNSDAWYEKCIKYKLKPVHWNLDPEAIKKINEIANLTGAKIVISSSWRFDPKTPSDLKASGLEVEIIGRTDYLNTHGSFIVRGNEIQKYISDNINDLSEGTLSYYGDYKAFVILDDDSDMLFTQADNFIHIDFMTGITDDNVKQAVKILNSWEKK